MQPLHRILIPYSISLIEDFILSLLYAVFSVFGDIVLVFALLEMLNVDRYHRFMVDWTSLLISLFAQECVPYCFLHS